MTNNVDISKRPFLDVMGAEVTALAKKFCLEGSKVFLLWFAKLAFDLSEDEAYESVLIDGPNDKSIDLFWVDDFANRVIVAQGKYSKTGSSKPKDNSVDSLLSSIDWLAQPEMLEREGKPELAEAARAYREAVDKETAQNCGSFIVWAKEREHRTAYSHLQRQSGESAEKAFL